MGYIKSHSNYVLKKKSQVINDGIIYERDFTTIGGTDRFAKGQIPIYKSSNFIITTNNDANYTRNFLNQTWAENSEGTVWTLDTISTNFDDTRDETMEVVLKPDFYDLRDFAYFGSCSELVRASLLDIIGKFPGELYGYSVVVGVEETATSVNKILSGDIAYYTYTDENNTYSNKTSKVLGNNGYIYILDNPFNIDLHTPYINEEDIKDPLKFFCNGGYMNYQFYTDEILENSNYDYRDDDFGYEITAFTVTQHDPCDDDDRNLIAEINIKIQPYVPCSATISADVQACDMCKATIAADVKHYNSSLFKSYQQPTVSNFGATNKDFDEVTIKAYLANGGNVVYLVNQEFIDYGIHIRPKKEFMKQFYKKLDLFEKTLMNKYTTPKYSATFEILEENEFTYDTVIRTFTFPLSYGGYNLAVANNAYGTYLSELSKVSLFYDENFSDNLWRSMTHESIKNFDWTYTRKFNQEEEDLYVLGGTRIQNLIRIFGREFDEIKQYIDGIKNSNVLNYQDYSSLPDYYLTDYLETDGWDVKNIYPLQMTEYIINNNGEKINVSDATENDRALNSYKGNKLYRIFEEDNTTKVQPYVANKLEYPYGYWYTFNGCDDLTTRTYNTTCNGEFYLNNTLRYYDGIIGQFTSTTKTVNAPKMTIKPSAKQANNYFVDNGVLRERIKSYSSNRIYTANEVNNLFAKILKLNSKAINRAKGTINGIDMVMGLFGLKNADWYANASERFTNRYKKNYDCYIGDYSITEQTILTNGIVDKWDAYHSMHTTDWYNFTKTVVYDNDDYRNGIYHKYQGLPIKYYYTEDENGNIYEDSDIYMFPYFNKEAQLDGNPYYQMNGGWKMQYPFMLDNDNNRIMPKINNKNNSHLYEHTIRNIKSINNLQELIATPQESLYNGQIFYVANIKGEYGIVDGSVYELFTEMFYGKPYKYFIAQVINGAVKIGSIMFSDELIVSYPYDDETYEIKHILSEYENGSEIKVYVLPYDDEGYPDDTLIEGEGTMYNDVNAYYSIRAFNNANSINTFTYFRNGSMYSDEVDNSTVTNYFKINNTNFKMELSDYGWMQMKTTDYDYYRVNSEKDYNKGNNPHTAEIEYDGGYEYTTYFSRLFKYAYDNNEIDQRCFPKNENPVKHMININNIGFHRFDENWMDNCIDDYETIADTKIHFFGDKIVTNGNCNNNVTKYKYWNYENKNKTLYKTDEFYDLFHNGEYYANIIQQEGLTADLSTLAYGVGDMDFTNEEKVKGIDWIGVPEQVINTKVITLTFYLKNGEDKDSKVYNEEIQYLNYIVNNYVTQMIPSTAIFKVNYTKACKQECEITISGSVKKK